MSKEELQMVKPPNGSHNVAIDNEETQAINRRNPPPTTDFTQLVALLGIFLLVWCLGYVLFPTWCAPDTAFMRMIFLFVGAQICGILITYIKLPDMLGMLFFGVLYTNLGLGNFSDVQPLEAFLREMALINIMLLAGLGLDLEPLKKLFRIIMQLVLVPTIAEVTVLAVLSHFLLNLPWIWGIMLGLVVTAISPNVVVTVLLQLREERLGLNKGIHTLIIANCSLNDVISIFLFGVVMGIVFATGDLTSQILQGPIGIVIGLVYGVAAGLLLIRLPNVKSKYVNGLKFTMIVLIGTLSVIGSKAIKYPSAGALGCITTAFIASEGWKKQGGEYENNEVSMYLDLLWKFLKPISFSLIGKEVNFSVLDGNMVLYGAITLFAGVAIRALVSYYASLGAGLDWKERAYVTLSSLPKATVQAALGPLALDMARKLNSEANMPYAEAVLIISVLAIIFTAPLAAVLMIHLAPKWLQRQS